MGGPLAGEDRSKHARGAGWWFSCVGALLLPLQPTPSAHPGRRIAGGPRCWRAESLPLGCGSTALLLHLLDPSAPAQRIRSEPTRPPPLFPSSVWETVLISQSGFCPHPNPCGNRIINPAESRGGCPGEPNTPLLAKKCCGLGLRRRDPWAPVQGLFGLRPRLSGHVQACAGSSPAVLGRDANSPGH